MGGGSSTKTTNQNEQATTVPQTPAYAQDPVKNYYAGINNYQQSDPYAFVTPTNALQNGAFNNASGLFQSGALYGQAAQGASNVMNATPTTYTAGFNGAQTGLLGPASQAGANGYQAPSLGQAAQTQSPTLGSAAQAGLTNASAAQAGPASTANLSGYSVGNLGNAAQAAPVNLGQAAQTQSASLLDGFDRYHNPATQALVTSTLASMDDQQGRALAAQRAQAAKSGAFGGSRDAIASSQLQSDFSRERALADANLRSNAWQSAAGLSAQDAAMRQATNLANMGAQNQRDETRAGLESNLGMFNAGQQNQFDLTRFGAQNDAARYGADAANQGVLFNAGAQNDVNLANAGYSQAANLANANNANSQAQFNAGQANDFAIRGADLAQQAGLANMQAQNQYGLAQGQMQADAAQFGANAQNAASLANMAAQNQYGLAQFDAQNQANLSNAAAANDMSKFNTEALNTAQQQQLARQLQASGLLGDLAGNYASDYRSDLAMQSDLGNQLYQLQDRYNQAPLTQLQNIGNLLQPGLIDSLSGKTITSNQSGVSQEKKSGGLFNSLLGIASVATPFIPSDRRLKTDIRRVGRTNGGLPIYTYRYKGDQTFQMGVMAQDVEQSQPQAIGPEIGGYKTVNLAEVR